MNQIKKETFPCVFFFLHSRLEPPAQPEDVHCFRTIYQKIRTWCQIFETWAQYYNFLMPLWWRAENFVFCSLSSFDWNIWLLSVKFWLPLTPFLCSWFEEQDTPWMEKLQHGSRMKAGTLPYLLSSVSCILLRCFFLHILRRERISVCIFPLLFGPLLTLCRLCLFYSTFFSFSFLLLLLSGDSTWLPVLSEHSKLNQGK